MLAGPLDVPYAGVAWVSLVVGLHFFPLASILGVPPFRWLGAGIAGCGVIGLAMAGLGASEPPIAAVGGVLPGSTAAAGRVVGSDPQAALAPVGQAR